MDATTSLRIVMAASPLEGELLGSELVQRVLEGQAFENVDGGRHIDLQFAIEIIACTASVVQCAFAAWQSFTPAADKAPGEPELLERALSEAFARARHDAALKAALARDPELVRRVVTEFLKDTPPRPAAG